MGEGHTDDEPPVSRRLTVDKAARHFGITESAVRGRIKRNTLRSQRDAGRVYVIIRGDEASFATPGHDESTDAPTDQSELVAVLREQLEAERQAHAEARRIIAGLVERIPAIESSASGATEARESPESPGPTPTPQEYTEERQAGAEGPERRPWWRRMFGG